MTKKRFLLHFNPVRVWVLTIVVEDVTFFLLLFTCFILFFFQEYLRFISCTIVLKKFVSLTIVTTEMGKRQLS